MPAITVSGVLERVDIRQEKPFDPYVDRYGGDHYSCFLECAMRCDDGTSVYFKTPAAMMNIGGGGMCPVAVVTFDFPGTSGRWLKEVGEQRVASAGQSNDNRLVPLVTIGQHITIRGSVKRETTSKAGRFYRVLNRVTIQG